MSKPKVLLINPDPNPYVAASRVDFGAPMAILAIGTYLKHNGLDVRVIDGRLHKGGEIFRLIDEEIDGVKFVGLSVMTAQIGEALRVAEYVKKRHRTAKVVWGGVHPTLFPEQTLMSPFVDFIVIGEGDVTALELARAIDGGAGASGFRSIRGAGFKDGGDIVINRRRELMRMDDIPPQAFELLDAERYINAYYPFVGPRRELLVQTSRGCPHRCAFCINYVERNYNIWRSKSPALVIDEVKELKKRYSLNAISFRDENFFVNRSHAEKVIDGLRGLDIRWFANVRADYFTERHVSGDLLKAARESGAAYLGVGAESGSERILELISKDITVEQIVSTAEQMNRFDIVASYSFVIGIPGETIEEMMKTVDLMRRLKRICRRSIFSGPQILRPYPGGSLYDLCVKYGYNTPASLAEWASQRVGKFGELSLDNYPWLKNPRLVTALSTFVPAALNYDFMKDLDLKRKVYAYTARLRLRFNFWLFPYEYQLTMSALKFGTVFMSWVRRIFKRRGE